MQKRVQLPPEAKQHLDAAREAYARWMDASDNYFDDGEVDRSKSQFVTAVTELVDASLAVGTDSYALGQALRVSFPQAVETGLLELSVLVASGDIDDDAGDDFDCESSMDELCLCGRQGKTLTVSGDTLKIEKRGLAGFREKTILIRNITAVEVKKPGGYVGFIQFAIAGGHSRDGSYTLTGGAFDAVKDENSVVFAHLPEYEIALRIKAYVESWAPESDVRSTREPAPQSGLSELRQLKELLDDGILTQQEFDLKKRQILGL